MAVERPRQPDGRVHGVVVACHRADGRYLCIRRSATVAAPLKVCFPGGTMETGESQIQTARREMREELGIDVTLIQCVWRWDSPSSELTLWGWSADAPTTEPMPNDGEVSELLWLTPQEATDHPDAVPTNRLFISALVEARQLPNDISPFSAGPAGRR